MEEKKERYPYLTIDNIDILIGQENKEILNQYHLLETLFQVIQYNDDDKIGIIDYFYMFDNLIIDGILEYKNNDFDIIKEPYENRSEIIIFYNMEDEKLTELLDCNIVYFYTKSRQSIVFTNNINEKALLLMMAGRYHKHSRDQIERILFEGFGIRKL